MATQLYHIKPHMLYLLAFDNVFVADDITAILQQQKIYKKVKICNAPI